MTLAEAPKQVANVAVATAPAISYLSGLSIALTILASIVSILWMASSLFKLFFPKQFEAFVKRIDG